MKITICGSLTFNKEFLELKNQLEEMGHIVYLPESTNQNQTKEYWVQFEKENHEEFVMIKRERMKLHFQKIIDSDAILVANYEKNNTPGYIGLNTYIEMGIALEHDKQVYILYTPTNEKAKEEVDPMMAVQLEGDLTKI